MNDTPQTIAELIVSFPQTGLLEWVGVRPVKREAMQVVLEADVIAGLGLQGDHRLQGQPGGKRQVTLIQAEHLLAITSLSGHGDVIRLGDSVRFAAVD